MTRSPLLGLGWLLILVWLLLNGGTLNLPSIPWLPIPGIAVKAGEFRVLFLVEESEKYKLSSGQRDAIDSLTIRNYLAAKTAKDPDGKTPGWRVWDDDFTDQQLALAAAPWTPVYKEAVKDHTSTPWLFVMTTSGREVYSAAIPETASEESVLAQLKQYGGN